MNAMIYAAKCKEKNLKNPINGTFLSMKCTYFTKNLTAFNGPFG